jgi:hypothetical protein
LSPTADEKRTPHMSIPPASEYRHANFIECSRDSRAIESARRL